MNSLSECVLCGRCGQTLVSGDPHTCPTLPTHPTHPTLPTTYPAAHPNLTDASMNPEGLVVSTFFILKLYLYY